MTARCFVFAAAVAVLTAVLVAAADPVGESEPVTPMTIAPAVEYQP